MADEIKLGVKIDGLQDGLAALQKLQDGLAALNMARTPAGAHGGFSQWASSDAQGPGSQAGQGAGAYNNTSGAVQSLLAASGINATGMMLPTGGEAINIAEAEHLRQQRLSTTGQAGIPGGPGSLAATAQGGPIQVSVVASIPLFVSHPALDALGHAGGSAASSGSPVVQSMVPSGGEGGGGQPSHRERHQRAETEGWAPAKETWLDRMIHRGAEKHGVHHLSTDTYNKMANPADKSMEPDEFMRHGYRMELGEEFAEHLPSKGVQGMAGRWLMGTESFRSVSEGLAMATQFSPGIGRAIHGYFNRASAGAASEAMGEGAAAAEAAAGDTSAVAALTSAASGGKWPGGKASPVAMAGLGEKAVAGATSLGEFTAGAALPIAAAVIPLELTRAAIDFHTMESQARFQTDLSIQAQQASGEWVNPYIVGAKRRAADVRGNMAVQDSIWKGPVASKLTLGLAPAIYEANGRRSLETQEQLEEARGEQNEKLQDIQMITGGKREEDTDIARAAQLQGIAANPLSGDAFSYYFSKHNAYGLVNRLDDDIKGYTEKGENKSALTGADLDVTRALGGLAFGQQDSIKGLVTNGFLQNFENPGEAAQGIGIITSVLGQPGFARRGAALAEGKTTEELTSNLQAGSVTAGNELAARGDINGLVKVREAVEALAEVGVKGADKIAEAKEGVEKSFEGMFQAALKMREVQAETQVASTRSSINQIEAQRIATRGGSGAAVARQIEAGGGFLDQQVEGYKAQAAAYLKSGDMPSYYQALQQAEQASQQKEAIPRQAFEEAINEKSQIAQAATVTAQIGLGRERFGTGGVAGLRRGYAGEVEAARQTYDVATERLQTPNLRPGERATLMAQQQNALFNLQLGLPAQEAQEEYSLTGSLVNVGREQAQTGLAVAGLAGGTQAGVTAAYGAVAGNTRRQRDLAASESTDMRLTQEARNEARQRTIALDRQLEIELPRQEAAQRYGRVGADIGVQQAQAGAQGIQAALFGGPEQQRGADLAGASVIQSQLTSVNTQIASAGTDKISYEALQKLYADQATLMARLAQATEQPSAASFP